MDEWRIGILATRCRDGSRGQRFRTVCRGSTLSTHPTHFTRIEFRAAHYDDHAACRTAWGRQEVRCQHSTCSIDHTKLWRITGNVRWTKARNTRETRRVCLDNIHCTCGPRVEFRATFHHHQNGRTGFGTAGWRKETHGNGRTGSGFSAQSCCIAGAALNAETGGK